jgi:hypothetical protein
LIRWFLIAPYSGRRLGQFNFWLFLALVLLSSAAWVVYLLAYYPGVMSPDSIDQWHQAHTLRLADYHPAVHTLTIRLLTLAWDSPAAVSLFQIVALSLCLAYACVLLVRAGVPRVPVIVAYGAAVLSPHNGNTVVVLWKDIPYAIVVFLFVIMVTHMLLDPKRATKRLPWILLGGVLALIPLYRHNGLAIYVAMLPALILVFWPSRRRVAWGLFTALFLFGAVKWVVFPVLDVTPIKKWERLYRMRNITGRISALVDQDVPFAPAEYEFLSRVRAMDDRWAYSPITEVATIWNPRMDDSFGVRNLDRYIDLHDELLTRYPLVFLRHKMRNTNYLYWPPQPGEERIRSSQGGIVRNDLGLEMAPKSKRLHEWVTTYVNRSTAKDLIWLFWRPAFHLYAAVIAMGVLLWRLRDWRLVLPYSVYLVNTLGIFLYATSQHHRYQFPLTVATGFLVCLAFLPRGETVAAAGVGSENRGSKEAAVPGPALAGA